MDHPRGATSSTEDGEGVMNHKMLTLESKAAPSWWNDQHTRSWERAKSALPGGLHSEGALRYGFGAASYYSDHVEWNRALEAKLRDDWREVDASRDWISVREDVRRGWDYARGIGRSRGIGGSRNGGRDGEARRQG